MAAPTSEAFRRWFRASKVVDARGEPLVVYHGTRAGFTDFAPGLSDTASRTGVPEGAFYFTSSPKVAATYPAETRRRYYEGANIVPVYLSLQNPLVVGYSVPDPDLAPSWDRIPFQGRKRTINEIAHYAREHGYDGVIARSIYDRGYGDLPFAQSVADTYIAFHPTQIKSATGNAGTFDSNDPDIRRNPMNTYNALHAAAGDALRAWMNTHRDEVERRMRAPATVREYRYGARNRPIGYATVPSGYVRIEDAVPDETRTRHGIVVYDRPLTDEEVRGYELHPYMPLAEVVEHLLTRLSRYGEKLADNVRKSGDRMIRGSVGSELDRLSVYTDIPMGEVYTHVAQELLRRFPAPELPTEPVREYRYGARNRPPGFGTVPNGFIRVDPPPFPQEVRTRHGVVVYTRPLTDEEVRGYELHPYMPLAEVVDGGIASLGEYARDYADNVREEGAEQVDGVGSYFDDNPVYTDVPRGEVYKHVAAELLRRFPA
jgi:hypothetical protein